MHRVCGTGLKLTQAFFRPPPSGRVKTPNVDDPQSAEHGLHAMLLVGYKQGHTHTQYLPTPWHLLWVHC